MSTEDKLTPREREVLALMAAGKTNAEISRTLSISFPTAKTHVSSILAKFGAESREEAVQRWRAGRQTERPLRGWAPWLVLLAAGGFAVGGGLALRPLFVNDGAARTELIISLDELPVDEPVRRELPEFGESPFGTSYGAFITRHRDGSVTAFLDRDPHSGCVVAWQPDQAYGDWYHGSEYVPSGTGAFRDPCGGWMYSLSDGRRIFGASPRGLDGFEVRLEGATARLDLSRIRLGVCDQQVVLEPCSSSGSAEFASEPPPPVIPSWGRSR